MSERFFIQRRVEFCETDAAGIAHFSAFFTYMEQAEHALLRALGSSVVIHDAEGVISWPRVAAACQYDGMARFEELLDVAVSVQRVGRTSVSYEFEFTHEGRPVAHGTMTSVCCRIGDDQPKPMSIPGPLADKLRTYLKGAEPDSEA